MYSFIGDEQYRVEIKTINFAVPNVNAVEERQCGVPCSNHFKEAAQNLAHRSTCTSALFLTTDEQRINQGKVMKGGDVDISGHVS